LTIITVPEKRVVTRIHEGTCTQRGAFRRRPDILVSYIVTRIKGTHTEVQYELLSYGIPVDSLPITADGEVKTAGQRKWITRRREKEMNIELYGSNFGRVDFPTNNDILLGKGRPFSKHPGNIYLKSLIDLNVQTYHLARSKAEKVKLAYKVVQDVHVRGGRFLVRDKDDWWVPTTDQDACDKVGKYFMGAQMELKRSQGNASSSRPVDTPSPPVNRSCDVVEEQPLAKRARLDASFHTPCFGFCT